MKKLFILFIFPVFFLTPLFVRAADLVQDEIVIEKSQVTNVSEEHKVIIPGTDTESPIQTIEVKILEGKDNGSSATFKNDYIQLKEGDIFYLRHTTNSMDGGDAYSVADPYRLDIIYLLLAIFIALLFLFGGIQGIRGLASLCGSLLIIFYVLLPGILHGYSPVAVSIAVSSLIIIVGSYVTHGFNKTTSAAVLGMMVTVVITGLAAYYAVHLAHLSGYNSEESTYLTFDSRGKIDLAGVLLGGIMIGLLGVLYDIAIGQAISVEELWSAGAHLPRQTIYKKAIRIGREHIGALVNTLAIAYVGVSLPLLLLLHTSTASISYIVNGEIFATEIIRVLIGSIGLIIAVPITTVISTWILVKEKDT